MFIKICGITNKTDGLNAIALGVNALGFIFYEKSSRYIHPDIAEEIAFECPPFTQLVGVFVNHSQKEIESISQKCKLDIIQLHGTEDYTLCKNLNKKIIKTVHINTAEDLEQIPLYQSYISSVLLDTKSENWGGTGESFDWGIAIKAKEYNVPIILSGGIKSSNIQKAIKMVNPYAIDLCSSIEEKPGKKNYNKMAEIVKLAQTH